MPRSKFECPMSQMGQNRTLNRLHAMSALPPKADIVQHGGNVRFVPKADISLDTLPAPGVAAIFGRRLLPMATGDMQPSPANRSSTVVGCLR